jgi:hypothetical protein
VETQQLGTLLVQACQGELTRIDEFQKKGQTPMAGFVGGDSGGYGGYGGYGGQPDIVETYNPSSVTPGAEMPSFGDTTGGVVGIGPKDPQSELFRRRIKYDVWCVQQGLNGVKNVANPNQASAVKRIEDEVKFVLAKADSPLAIQSLPGLHKSVKDGLMRLELLTGSAAPTKPKATDAVAAELPTAAPAPAKPAAGAGGPTGTKPTGTKPTGTKPAPALKPSVPARGGGPIPGSTVKGKKP